MLQKYLMDDDNVAHSSLFRSNRKQLADLSTQAYAKEFVKQQAKKKGNTSCQGRNQGYNAGPSGNRNTRKPKSKLNRRDQPRFKSDTVGKGPVPGAQSESD